MTDTPGVQGPILGTRVVGGGVRVASFGVASLDGALGGGVRVGGVVLVLGDRGSAYAALLLRYFAAQALASDHALCLVHAPPPQASSPAAIPFLASLPSPIAAEDDADDADDSNNSAGAATPTPTPAARTLGSLRASNSNSNSNGNGGAGTDLAIAWRYSHLPTSAAAPSPAEAAARAASSGGVFCSAFDMTKPAAVDAAKTPIAVVDAGPADDPAQHVYARILAGVAAAIDQGRFRQPPAARAPPPTLLRVVVPDVGGPAFASDAGSPHALHALHRFLACLHVLVRDARAVVLVALDAFLFKAHHVAIAANPHIAALMHAPVDAVLELESFAGSKRVFSAHFTKEYHGFLHVHKLTAPVSPLATSDLHSLAFRARRKRFLVEVFRPPPEKDDNESTPEKNASKNLGSGGGPGCGPTA
ncbi:Elongator subunit elp4, partial [Physocladia obscura]